MTSFTPWSALLGGALIGTSASLLLMVNGRIAGISGILAGLIDPPVADGERSWRAALLLGLLLGGVALWLLAPERFHGALSSPGAILAAGLLVGIGTRLSGGCTSGHGVCGVSRLSARSIAATVTFVAAGMITVYLGAVLGR
jgi:uncharacterized membrane protein YedE/YeeE